MARQAPRDRHRQTPLKQLRRRVRALLYAWLGRDEEAAFWYSRTIPGWFQREEIRLLYRTVRDARGPGDIAEIGSWKGRSTIVMARALREAGERSCRIWAIDPHLGSEEREGMVRSEGPTFPVFQRNLRNAGVDDLVEPLVMMSVEGARVLADKGVRLRLVFIDGAHDEESVREDIRAFLPLMRAGGLVAFHDCDPEGGMFPGVWKAFQSELADRVELVAHTKTLCVTRLPG